MQLQMETWGVCRCDFLEVWFSAISTDIGLLATIATCEAQAKDAHYFVFVIGQDQCLYNPTEQQLRRVRDATTTARFDVSVLRDWQLQYVCRDRAYMRERRPRLLRFQDHLSEFRKDITRLQKLLVGKKAQRSGGFDFL